MLRGMRLADLFDYLALRRHLAEPAAFLRLRKGGPATGTLDIPLRGGGSIRIRAGTMDRQILDRIFGRDEYRLDRLRPGSLDTVIDVGAHIGLFAIRAAPLARRIICLEPDPESFALLLANTARLPGVTALRRAVAGSPGTAVLRLSPEPWAHSTVSRPPREPGGEARTIEVEATTLSAVLDEAGIDRCGLLKLDCEGAEHAIFASTPREVWRRIDRIVLEVHPLPGDPGATPERIARLLEEAGHAAEVVRRKGGPGWAHIFSNLR
jgi:FkbM family methyltransferase